MSKRFRKFVRFINFVHNFAKSPEVYRFHLVALLVTVYELDL